MEKYYALILFGFIKLPAGPGRLSVVMLSTNCQNMELGWLVQEKTDHFRLSRDLPVPVKERLARINTPEHLAKLAARVEELPANKQPAPEMLIRLLDKAGLKKKASLAEIELVDTLLVEDQKNAAWHHLKRSADRLAACIDAGEAEKRAYIPAVLKLSNLAFTLGKGLMDLAAYLHKAHEVTEILGDRRSHALINMHLGRTYYFSDRRQEAMIALSTGLNEVEDLGDEDIMEQSAVFLGLFYFMQGLFKDARPHLNRAEHLYRQGGKGHSMTPLAPVLLGYCLAYLGEFHRAIA